MVERATASETATGTVSGTTSEAGGIHDPVVTKIPSSFVAVASRGVPVPSGRRRRTNGGSGVHEVIVGRQEFHAVVVVVRCRKALRAGQFTARAAVDQGSAPRVCQGSSLGPGGERPRRGRFPKGPPFPRSCGSSGGGASSAGGGTSQPGALAGGVNQIAISLLPLVCLCPLSTVVTPLARCSMASRASIRRVRAMGVVEVPECSMINLHLPRSIALALPNVM